MAIYCTLTTSVNSLLLPMMGGAWGNWGLACDVGFSSCQPLSSLNSFSLRGPCGWQVALEGSGFPLTENVLLGGMFGMAVPGGVGCSVPSPFLTKRVSARAWSSFSLLLPALMTLKQSIWSTHIHIRRWPLLHHHIHCFERNLWFKYMMIAQFRVFSDEPSSIIYDNIQVHVLNKLFFSLHWHCAPVYRKSQKVHYKKTFCFQS